MAVNGKESQYRITSWLYQSGLTPTRDNASAGWSRCRSCISKCRETMGPWYIMLGDEAREASKSSYSPYSNFPVGAAVYLSTGEIYTGCNVENAAYGSTICAERNAIFQAVATEGPAITIEVVAVYTPTPEPVPPCGACRQVINEFGPDALVLCVCDGHGTLEINMRDLLPYAFGPKNLEEKQ